MQRNSTTISLLAVIAGAIGISFAAIFAKKAMQSDIGPMASAFWRLVLAIPIFALLALPALRRGVRWTPLLLLPAAFFGFDLLFWHQAFQFTTAGMSTLLANVSVVFVGIGGWWLLKERLDWRWAAGAGCAMGGIGLIALMSQPGVGASNPLLGNLLSLGTALCYAGYLLSAKVLRRTVPASVIMLAVVAGAPVVLGLGVVLSSEHFMPGDGPVLVLHLGWVGVVGCKEAWLWIALMAIVPQTLGQGLVVWGLRNLPASFSAVVLLIQPIGTTIWGAMMLGEHLTAWDLGLGVLVLGGILLAKFGTAERTDTRATT